MNRSAIVAALFALNISTLTTSAFAADDWITINKDYSSQRYVDLDRITPKNVYNLKEICELRLNEPNVFSSGLLKVGRTLYVTTSRATYAFDAATCELRWRDVIELKQLPAASNSHGPGYLDGKIFRGTTDGRVIALDAITGRSLWDVRAADSAIRESFTSAPVAWNGKVFIGIATSDLAIAGRLMAFDADTGKELWRFNTTLDSSIAGGGFWTTYSLDPVSGEVFGPVSNPYPDWNRDLVANDTALTVYTDSVISVDAATGTLNWHYQAVPHDEHDWDLATAPTLYRTSAGKDMLAIAGKSGRVYGIDRASRKSAFNTPATTLKNDQVPLNGTWMEVCPGVQGGAMFYGPAYSPETGALYVGMSDHCAWYIKNKDFPMGGYAVKDWSTAAKLQAPRGWITAIDGESGAVLWQYQTGSQVLAGLVPTRSGLLFAGDTSGNLLIFNATNGSLLKSITAGGALNSGLISYSVDGLQYVAATVGGYTENPSTVVGPLRVIVYGLQGSDRPNVVVLPRLGPYTVGGITPNMSEFLLACSQCHGPFGAGSSAPPITRQSQLADPKLLKQFLATVRPPMPRLYPGLLNDKEVEMIAEFLKTSVFKCGPDEPQSCEPAGKPISGGTPAWRAVYSVLTSPRCINCHPAASPRLPAYAGYPQDYPRQGDDRHPHYFAVLRGDQSLDPNAHGSPNPHLPGIGTPFERCTSCHGTEENDPATGIPGSFDPKVPGKPFWVLAPAEVAWESAPGVPFTGAELCAQLKDPKRNGNRTLGDLLEHLEGDNFVAWGFAPGIRPNGEARTTPPISHAALVQSFRQWMKEGAPCP